MNAKIDIQIFSHSEIDQYYKKHMRRPSELPIQTVFNTPLDRQINVTNGLRMENNNYTCSPRLSDLPNPRPPKPHCGFLDFPQLPKARIPPNQLTDSSFVIPYSVPVNK